MSEKQKTLLGQIAVELPVTPLIGLALALFASPLIGGLMITASTVGQK